MNRVPSFSCQIAAALSLTGVLLLSPDAVRAGETSAASPEAGGGARVVGSGRVSSVARALGAFQAIEVRAPIEVVLRQGAREGLQLRGDDNLLSMIETTVVDRGGVPTLEIAVRPGRGYATRHPIVATVDLVTLRSLAVTGSGDVVGESLKTTALAVALRGSGDVTLRGLTADALSAQLSGSGDLRFAGRSRRLDVVIAGSGDVDARRLDADEVRVSIGGSGDARVAARTTLAVAIAGSGSVRYTGDATVQSTVAGSGEVVRD